MPESEQQTTESDAALAFFFFFWFYAISDKNEKIKLGIKSPLAL